MSRCPECNSKYACSDWCGKTKEQLQEEIEDLNDRIRELEGHND